MPMRPSHSRPRIAAVATLCCSLAFVLAPAPAQAATTTAGAVAETSFDADGAPGCAVTDSTEGTTAVALPGSGKQKTVTRSSTAKVVDAADLADETDLTSAGTTRASMSLRSGAFVGARVSTSVRATVDAAQGLASECDATAEVTVGLQMGLVLGKAGWLTTRASSTGPGVTQMYLEGSSGEVLGVTLTFGPSKSEQREIFLPADTYMVMVAQTASVSTPVAPSDPSSVRATFDAVLAFTKAGGATGPVTGNGKKYVAPAAARSCSAGTVSARWKAAAGNVRSARFFLDGRQVKAVKAPRKGTTVKLRGLSRPQDATLGVVMKLASGKTVAVSRSYVSCE